MTVFKTVTHEEVWIDNWCHTCFERHEAERRLTDKDTQCPILARYFRSKAKGRARKPPEWERTRKTTMVESIKCTEHRPRPDSVKPNGDKDFEDVPMFDVQPTDYALIPVEGLPNRLPTKGVDHA